MLVLKARELRTAKVREKTEGSKVTYYLNDVKALVMDYGDLPMALRTKEDIEAVSLADLKEIKKKMRVYTQAGTEVKE
jgi:hypothetical protein